MARVTAGSVPEHAPAQTARYDHDEPVAMPQWEQGRIGGTIDDIDRMLARAEKAWSNMADRISSVTDPHDVDDDSLDREADRLGIVNTLGSYSARLSRLANTIEAATAHIAL